LTGILYLTNYKSAAFMGKDDNMAAVRGECSASQITARIFRGRFVCAGDAHRSVCNRTSEALQACLERAPQAKHYYSDAFPAYDNLYEGALYERHIDKIETHSVGAVNADLRHYLKRLARKSRCFSRRMPSLAKNIQLFVYCYNQRQLAKRRFPKYSFRLIDFLSLLL
jgi:IS1 family transposase